VRPRRVTDLPAGPSIPEAARLDLSLTPSIALEIVMSDETPVHLFAQRFAAEADKDFDRCNGLYSRVSSAKTARDLFREAVKGDRQSRLILNEASNTWITQRVKEDYFRLAGALLAAGYTRPEMVNLVRHALIGRGEFSTDVAIAAELYARDTVPEYTEGKEN
jgi:hypothetical protein